MLVFVIGSLCEFCAQEALVQVLLVCGIHVLASRSLYLLSVCTPVKPDGIMGKT